MSDQTQPVAALEAEHQSEVIPPTYSDTEKNYLSNLYTLIFRAQQDRDKKHPELNGMSYMEYYESNERIANTFVQGKKFEGDVQIASGTVEQKMLAVPSEINRLSLTPEVLAFDDRDNEMVALGHAMTDVIFKTAEWENDREKRIMRQMELLKQGNCFMQENWVKRYRTQKEYDKTLIGKISEDTWNAVMKLEYEGPERRILYAPGVFMGDIRQPESAKQPFIFTHVLSSFADVKGRFGGK